MSAPTTKAIAGRASLGGDSRLVSGCKPDASDPLYCATCGEIFITADGKWRVCIDCPHKTIADIQPKPVSGVVVSIDLTHLVRVVRSAFRF